MREEKTAFDKDIELYGQFKYTTTTGSASISQRIDKVLTGFKGKRIIDIGCGDGIYTVSLYDRTKPVYISGVDVLNSAIISAKTRIGNRNIKFEYGDMLKLNCSERFDVAIIKITLHHLGSL